MQPRQLLRCPAERPKDNQFTHDGRHEGLLGTHLTYNYGQKVIFKELTEVNRKKKPQNIENLNYFLQDLTCNIKKDLVLQLVDQYFGGDLDLFYNGNYSDIKNIPLFVQESYNAKVTSIRNSSLLTFAENKFTNYIHEIKSVNRYINIERSNSTTGQIDRDYLKLETRYSCSYTHKVEKRMRWLAHTYRRSGCVYLVLTVDPKKYGYDKVRMWREIKQDLIKFNDKVRRHLNRHGRKMPKYLCTIEAQKQPKSCGNPHINMVYFGCNRLLDWKQILKYWGKGGIRINRTYDNQRVRNPVMYVTKYITKTFTDTNADNCLTQSLVWLFNVKSYTCSRGLVVPLKPKSTGEWSGVGVVICDIQQDIFEDYKLMDQRIYNLYSMAGDPH